jgi:hypothetical protein
MEGLGLSAMIHHEIIKDYTYLYAPQMPVWQQRSAIRDMVTSNTRRLGRQ